MKVYGAMNQFSVLNQTDLKSLSQLWPNSEPISYIYLLTFTYVFHFW